MLKIFHTNTIEAGCDEAGRGCLAGPVYAAAVILPSDFSNELINDSKQLSEKQRLKLRPILEEAAVDFGVGIVDAKEIDELNIFNASYLAMYRAICQMKTCPKHLIIDGKTYRHPSDMQLFKISEHICENRSFGKFKKSDNPTSYPKIPVDCIVKGDATFMSIAAASILAKTYRDDFMIELAKKFPGYDWESNKGYPTKKHKEGIKKLGITSFHRKSFHLFDNQLSLF